MYDGKGEAVCDAGVAAFFGCRNSYPYIVRGVVIYFFQEFVHMIKKM